jgi:hypothetical protein
MANSLASVGRSEAGIFREPDHYKSPINPTHSTNPTPAICAIALTHHSLRVDLHLRLTRHLHGKVTHGDPDLLRRNLLFLRIQVGHASLQLITVIGSMFDANQQEKALSRIVSTPGSGLKLGFASDKQNSD